MKPTKIERGLKENKRHDILASFGTFLNRCVDKAN